MLTDPASLSSAPLAQRVGVCELCSAGPETLRTAVLVRHARGGAVQLAACDRCAAAVRRLLAVLGGPGPSGPAQVIGESEASPLQRAVDTALSDTVGTPVLVHEFSEPFPDEAGQLYAVRVFGQERSDGTWIGWISFVAADDETVRRTPRETTQSNKEHLDYWATGLQLSYIEGAFRRTS